MTDFHHWKNLNVYRCKHKEPSSCLECVFDRSTCSCPRMTTPPGLIGCQAARLSPLPLFSPSWYASHWPSRVVQEMQMWCHLPSRASSGNWATCVRPINQSVNGRGSAALSMLWCFGDSERSHLPCRWWAALLDYFPIRSAQSHWPGPAPHRRRGFLYQEWRWTWSTCRVWRRTSLAGSLWCGHTGSWSAAGGRVWTAPATWSLLLLWWCRGRHRGDGGRWKRHMKRFTAAQMKSLWSFLF